MTQLLKEVALEGFEPSQAEPESDVLPLHHKAIQNVNFYRLACRICFTCAKVRHFLIPANFLVENFKFFFKIQ